MGEAIAFYRRWLATAFRGAVDRTALAAFVFVTLAVAAEHYRPTLRAMIDPLFWVVPFWIFATYLLGRMVYAPFLMWKEDRVAAASASGALEARNAELAGEVTQLTAGPPPHPDGIYQYRQKVGYIEGDPFERPDEGEIILETIRATQDFDKDADFEFRKSVLKLKSYSTLNRMPTGGASYYNVVAKVIRP